MKKVIILIFCLVLMPLGVSAMATSEVFNVGDSVAVDIYGDGEKIGFHVLESSPAGEKFVTLLYDGYVLTSDRLPFDDIDPEANPDDEFSNAFEGSYIQTKLNEAITNGNGIIKKWVNYEGSARLLQAGDLGSLGLTKNSDGNYEVKKNSKGDFLTPIINGLSHPEDANYWTGIAVGEDSVYVVYYNDGSYSDDIMAVIKPTVITPDADTVQFSAGIRPVVIVDKEYIICNNTSVPGEPDSPETGVADYLGFLAGVAILAGTLLFISRKNNAFVNI